MKVYKHTCLKEINDEKYHVRTCKACRQKIEVKKDKEEFDKQMSVKVEWDGAGQGELL